MRDLVREMIHFRKSLDPEDGRNPDQIDPDRVKEFEARYDRILETAKEEYEYVPPTNYYKNGFNLYKRLFAFKDNHLLFLRNKNVPWTNNLSERQLRKVKRKARQVMAFRSDEGLMYLCDSLGVIDTLRAQDGNLYDNVTSIFDRSLETSGVAAG